MDTTATYICFVCKKELTACSFHKDSSRRSGYSNRCKVCQQEKSAKDRKTMHWAEYQRKRLAADNTKRLNKLAQQRAWHKRNPLVQPAYDALHKALKDGTIVRPKECSECKKVCKPEAHHDDYTKPLDVVWVCKLCHGARLRK